MSAMYRGEKYDRGRHNGRRPYIGYSSPKLRGNGDIDTVAMIDGFESEATVKTFTEKKVTIRLQPARELFSMSPIIVRKMSRSFEK